MQKRSHKLLAQSLIDSYNGFAKRRFELAFLFGSFEPDCNPLSYIKGSRRGRALMGHNFSNSQAFIHRRIRRLQDRDHWTVWQYYTLGKLTHYLADAFTYPHNENYPDSLMDHRRYEDALRVYMAGYLARKDIRYMQVRQDLADAIEALHQKYMESAADMRRDAEYILEATELLMAGCLPPAVRQAV